MARTRSWIAALTMALAAASAPRTAAAGDIRCTSLDVTDHGAADVVTVKGTLSAPAELSLPSALEFRCGAYAQTIPAESLRVTKSAVSFRARKKTPGIQSLTLSRKTGKFTLTAKGVEAGSPADLDDPDNPFVLVLDVGGQRVSVLLPLTGTGAKRSWRKGRPFHVDIAIRVLEVTNVGGNALLAPATGRTFEPSAATPPVGFEVKSAETQVGDDGLLRARIETSDPAVLDRIDLNSVIGPGRGLTPAPASRVTAGDDGESDAVTFVEEQKGEARTVSSVSAETFVVDASAGGPAGTLTVPAGAVASSLPGVRFTPLTFAVQLPAPLPDGYTPIAGAEISAATPAQFVPASAPTMSLARPRWVDRDALAESDIRLLSYAGGAWTEQPGRGAYDAATDAILPDASEPARIAATGVSVYAARSAGVAGKDRALAKRKVVRGRVVGASGRPIRGQAVLTRAGAMVTGADGAFSVDRSALASDSLEVVQAVGQASSSSRVVSAAEASAGVEIRAPDAPAEIRFGRVSGTAYEAGGVTPSPGASVTIRLASAVRGLVLDDKGTPDAFIDDIVSVPDLSNLGVNEFVWNLTIPGDDQEFTSSVTGPEISPTDVILEAQTAGRNPGEGAYTLRVSYTVPVLGELSLYAGFRVSVEGITPGVSDVQLPAALEGTAARTVVADANGRYQTLLRAPVGIPMTGLAVRADQTKIDTPTFQFSTDVTQDFVFPVDPDAPVPAGLVLDAWVARAPMAVARSHAGSVASGGKVWVAGGRGAGGAALDAFEVFDPVANAWTTLAPMSVARDNCSLAAAGGRIYAIGGWNGSAVLASVEMYDPVSGTWTPRASMDVPREDAKSVALGSKIYVCSGTTVRGGAGTDPTVRVDVYDTATDAWSAGPDMPTALRGGDAVAYGGRIYVRGDGGAGASQVWLDPGTALWTADVAADGGGSVAPGFCAANNELWIVDGNAAGGLLKSYDVESETYGARPASPRGRTFGCAEAVDGIIYSFGGDVSGAPSATVDAYRPAWKQRTGMPTARHAAAAAAALGRVYVAGGDDGAAPVATLEAFDPSRNIWTSRAPMATARANFGFVTLDDRIYAVGGTGAGGAALASVERYDPVTNAWTPRAAMSKPRAGAAVMVLGGRIYAAGGGDATVEVYNPATDAWTTRASMATARFTAEGAAGGTLLFVVGGSDGAGSLASCEAYNPANNTWSARNPVPGSAGQERQALATVGGRIHSIGGRDSGAEGSVGTALRYVNVFEVAANRWSAGPSLPRGLRDPAAAVLDGVIYVVGGKGSRGGADHYDGNDHVHRTLVSFKPE